ncbi:MAG: hypothetical protein JW874_05260 [Spirochaetales bacterium]|nr:hypothetical protein [Spirochaetales bacterium]
MIVLVLHVLREMFGSFELGLIVLCFLVFFPLVFILASLKPKVRKPASTKKEKDKKPASVKKKKKAQKDKEQEEAEDEDDVIENDGKK